MKLKKRTRHFLKCSHCRYSILGQKTKARIDREKAKRDGLTY